jgi:serine/threonine protein kinase
MTRFQEEGTMTQCGSPLWMAPEMIKNEPYDEKSDVYSFGIVLWELYTRKIPYRKLGLNPSHLVVKVVKEALRPGRPSHCPPAYVQLMEKCWHPVAERRPTFSQVLKILEV